MRLAVRYHAAILALSLCWAINTAYAANFLDLNSLRAFSAANTPEELSVLSLNQSPPNITSAVDEPSLNPSYAFSASKDQGSQQDAESEVSLHERDGDCGSYNSCSSLGAPSLCCAPNQICSADTLGRVGCCPLGAACTGTIPGAGGVVASTTTSEGSGTTRPATTTTTSTTSPTDGGFVIAGSSTVAVFGQGSSNAMHLRVVSTLTRWQLLI